MTNKRAECLDKAKECVCQSRESDHGSPEDSFKTIASLWTGYLDKTVTPTDVCMMMALLKVARVKTGHGKDDSFIDLAGYAACGMEVNRRADRLEQIQEIAEVSYE
ncbi:hypothetical protein Ami103574_02495 [Aminipila butyrica]|uniref:DUF6378 domain-containing protein n=1 Tax=Aminipila butyrica TaxID=433296 RepID=A0A858BSR1_9FIRM|nr:DUF6378 domain-containing protein [Aminipila butyrica]QIB68249.1 hypothetical protein Ami103574_02495 [Aminipila butyrica]